MQKIEVLKTELRQKGFSEKTIDSYVFYNQKFLNFIKKQPEEIQEQDINKYLTYLIADKQMSPRSLALIISSLRFFYVEIIKKQIFQNIQIPKRDKNVPTVLTKEEIKKLINLTKNKKHQLLIKLLYSSGLKVSEIVKLKKSDLDLKQKVGYTKASKEKTKTFIVAKSILPELEEYLESKEKDEYLFFSKSKQSHITIRAAQKAVNKAAQRADMKKRVFCHALRSSFAEHLLESGISQKQINQILNNSIQLEDIKKIQSPLDVI